MYKDYMSLEMASLLLGSECSLQKIILLPPASGTLVPEKHDHSEKKRQKRCIKT